MVLWAGPIAQCWVVTAGPGLSRDTAWRLREAGLAGVILSLDHWEAGAHDAFRGRVGTFEGVVQGVRHARQAGLAVALGLCPTREFTTAENLEAYRRIAVDLGVDFIQVMEPRAKGQYADHDIALLPGAARFAGRILPAALLRGGGESHCILPGPGIPKSRLSGGRALPVRGHRGLCTRMSLLQGIRGEPAQ